MNGIYVANAYRIDYIEKELKENKKKLPVLKCISAFLVFMLYVGRTTEDAKSSSVIYWLFTLSFVVFFFGLSIKINYRNRDLIMLKYKIEKEELEAKKDLAEINGEVLSDDILMQKIEEPSSDVRLPIPYFSILIVLDILIFIFMY